MCCCDITDAAADREGDLERQGEQRGVGGTKSTRWTPTMHCRNLLALEFRDEVNHSSSRGGERGGGRQGGKGGGGGGSFLSRLNHRCVTNAAGEILKREGEGVGSHHHKREESESNDETPQTRLVGGRMRRHASLSSLSRPPSALAITLIGRRSIWP